MAPDRSRAHQAESSFSFNVEGSNNPSNFWAILYESLFVGVTRDQLKFLSIGFDTIRPEVFPHNFARFYQRHLAIVI